MPHLLYVWPSVSHRLRDASLVLLLFDYDGTLTPIVPQPDSATLPTETRELLLDLSRREKYILGVISGRSLGDVSARVGIEGLIYAGNHGLEIRGPGLDFLHQEAARVEAVQGRAYERLRDRLAGLPGVIIEHKGLTLSVHYRLTPDEAVGQVKAVFTATVSPFLEAGDLEIAQGKKVLEVRPNVSWDKGKAIAKLQDTFPQASLSVFFGDDLTDEDGFDVVQQSEGLAVFVGPALQPTKALYRLDSPEEVTHTLRLLAQLVASAADG